MRHVWVLGAGAALVAGTAAADDAPSVAELVITGRSQADVVQVGAFRNARVIDTPLTVNVITREVLDAQAANGLFDALRNTGGVTRSQLNGATYDNIAIRGILVENRGNYRLNGSLPVINLIEQPLEDKVRVEVLKGASGIYYGFVPPSGVINMTTKRAEAEPVATFTFRGDDRGSRIASVDLGRQFRDGLFGVRVNLAGGQTASFQDKVKGDRQLAALALDFQPIGDLSFRFDGEYIAKDIPEPAAIALLAPVDGRITLPARPDTNQNLAGKWQRYDADARNFLFRMDYRFASVFTLKLEAGRAQTNRDRAFSQFQGYNLATGEGTLRIFLAEGQKYVNDNVRGEVAATFDTGPLRHELVVGYTANKRYQNGRVNQIFSVAQNLYAPVEIAQRFRTIGLSDNPSTIRDKGAYALNRISLGEQWQAVLGVRRSDYESETRTTRYVAKKTTPSVALIYKPRPWLSLYGTYLEGVEEGGIAPANTVNAFEVLPPASTEQAEFGAKAELGGAVLSAAYFEITRPSAFTNSANRFVLDGETEYRGVEASAFGRVTDDITLTASALVLDAEQKRAANPLVIGKRPENTAKWTASLFAEWRPPMLEGFALNAGVFAMGNRAVNAANQGFIGGYATADLGLRYTRQVDGRAFTGQFNIENIFDKGYWSTAGNNLLGVGAPRTVKLTLSAAL